MIKTSAFALVAALSAGAAGAADKIVMAPPASWVQPVTLPPERKTDGAATHLILQDQQADLVPGRQTRYSETIMRIQTPQGLSAANVAFAWNPDTDTATVHKLQIRRGAKIIDLLATQSFTVVRRETNLENAMIDGVLTATLQPEGVQIGDVIDFAMSITQSDPALKSHVEEIGGGWNGIPADRVHMRTQWPSTVSMRLHQTVGLAPIRTVRKGGVSSAELTMDALQPIPLPKGAPLRYAMVRQFEMSDFANWSDLATLMAPLYAKAAALPADSGLDVEIATIARLSSDPKTRAAAALALVQDRVRYVYLGTNDGGLVPVDAKTTWSRRFGDCKGKAVLLLALLNALGIKAEPVIVSVGGGDGLDQRLPMVSLFNHVLVRATIAGQIYWLDGTRSGDTTLDLIVTPNFSWGLPLEAGATLVRMVAPQPALPQTETAIRIDASSGINLPARFHVETVLRGDPAVSLDRQLTNLASEVRERGLRDYWRSRYDFVDVGSVYATFDAAKHEERLVMDGAAKMEWNDHWYLTDGTGVGYEADFTRDPGPNADAPFAVAYPYSSRVTETILLPRSAFRVAHAEPIEETVAGIAYHRRVTLDGKRIIIEESEHSVASEISAAEAAAAQDTLRALSSRSVQIAEPVNYWATVKEVDAAMQTTPNTAEGFTRRGNLLNEKDHFDEAISDFTKAIALDYKFEQAYAGRGLSYAWKNEVGAATNDFAFAEKMNPTDPVPARGRAILADQRGDYRSAISEYSKSLSLYPASSFTWARRAAAYHAIGDYDHAIADAGEAIRLMPDNVRMYLLRANIFRTQGKMDNALREAMAVTAANPQSGYAYIVAGRIYGKYGRLTDAMREFDLAMKVDPTVDVLINRSAIRARDDYAERKADLDAAAKLDPTSAELGAAQAALQEDRGAYADAIVTWTAMLAVKPDDPYALVRRGIDHERLGHSPLASKDFAAARGLAKDKDSLNDLCWAKAAAGVALPSALADCDAALARAPGDALTIDSRAFVLLRLGRLEEAQSAYDKALAINPLMQTSLYGRAIVETRRGDKLKSDTDMAAALRIDPDIKSDFDRYGVMVDMRGAVPTLPKAG